MYLGIGLAILGFVLSSYLLYVEQQLKSDPLYKPVCDLSDRVSCSMVAKSNYSFFGIPFSLIGIVYYAMILGMVLFGARGLLLVATSGALVGSLVLAYIQYVKIRAICIVCTSVYFVNIALFIVALRAFFA